MPDDEQMAQLGRRGIEVEHGLIDTLAGERLDVVMRDGRIVSLSGLFTMTQVSVSSPIAEQLGCEFEEGPLGSVIRVDPKKATTISGVAAHQSLIFGSI